MAKISVSQLIEAAKKEIGTKATDIKRCKYNKWFYGADVSGSNYDWCMVFVLWLFNKLGAKDMLYIVTSNCGQQGKAFFEKGRLVTKDFQKGDIVFFHWSNNKSNWVESVYTMDHVGIIESVNADGTYTTIEGNTGSNNGEVMRRIRYKNQISCAGRPEYIGVQAVKIPVNMAQIYMGAVTNTKGQVLTLQRILNELKDGKGYLGKDNKKLILDGDFGINTDFALRSYQKAHNLEVDGICGKQSWSALLCEYKN